MEKPAKFMWIMYACFCCFFIEADIFPRTVVEDTIPEDWE